MILKKKLIFNFCNKLPVYFLLFIFLISCSSKEDSSPDLATTGNVSIKADEAFIPILESQKFIFESLYKKAQINLEPVTEFQAINNFVNGDASMIVIGRKLSNKEVEYVGKKNYSVFQTKIATDAIVLIANKNFKDSILSLSDLKDILNGNKKYWNDINNSFSKERIKIVIDQSNSSNLLYINEIFPISKDSISLVIAGSTSKVIEYVGNNNHCIGIIGWSWISDEEDPETIKILNKIKALPLGTKDKLFYPTVEEINDSLYPLTRPIYSINKGARAGLASGFSSFIASDRGQRIILKSGIVPATVPGREIEIK